MSETKKTVLIHIGAGKTGTTAIQNCLLANAELLKKNGVWVPNGEYFLKGHPSALQSCGNGVKLFYLLTDYADQPWLDKTEFLNKIEGGLHDSYRFIVFSCEYLQYVHGNRLGSFRDFCAERGAQVKIVYCVRDFASHAFSSWRQLVIHHGESSEWPRFQTRYANDAGLSGFETTLRKFTSVIAHEDVIVLNYSSFSRDISRHFFELFDEDYDNYHPAAIDNASETNLTIDIMLEFNKIVAGKFDPKISRAFYEAIYQVDHQQKSDGPGVLLSNSEYDRFRRSLQPQLDYVNGTFLTRDPIVVAHPDQIGETGRLSDTRLAVRMAEKTVASLADELPSLRVFRRSPSPIDLVRRFGRFITERSLGRRLR